MLGWCKAPDSVSCWLALPITRTAWLWERLCDSMTSGKSTDDSLPAIDSDIGPLALGDVDGDGDLIYWSADESFQEISFPASSRLFRNDGGTLRVDSENKKVLEQAGLVSGAVFSDLDGDGDPDLILACECSLLRIDEMEYATTECQISLNVFSPEPQPQPSTR